MTVIDNNSDDSSIKEIMTLFPEVSIKKMYSNTGTIAFNKCIEEFLEKKGDYLFISNNDIIYDENFVKYSVDFADEHEDAGIITPQIRFINKACINSTGIIMNRSGYAWDRDFGEFSDKFERMTGEVFIASGGAMFLKAAAIDEAGYFDPIYHAYYEDVDLSLSLRMKTDFKIYFLSEALCYHAFSQSWKQTGMKDYYMMRNRFITVIKYFPLRMLLNALRYLFFTSTTGCRDLDRRVYFDLIRLLPSIVMRRFKVMMFKYPFPPVFLEQYHGLPVMSNKSADRDCLKINKIKNTEES